MGGEYADREKRPEPERRERSLYREPEPEQRHEWSPAPRRGEYGKNTPGLFTAYNPRDLPTTIPTEAEVEARKANAGKTANGSKHPQDTRTAKITGESGVSWDSGSKLFEVVIGGTIVGTAATWNAASDLYHHVMKSSKDQGGGGNDQPAIGPAAPPNPAPAVPEPISPTTEPDPAKSTPSLFPSTAPILLAQSIHYPSVPLPKLPPFPNLWPALNKIAPILKGVGKAGSIIVGPVLEGIFAEPAIAPTAPPNAAPKPRTAPTPESVEPIAPTPSAPSPAPTAQPLSPANPTTAERDTFAQPDWVKQHKQREEQRQAQAAAQERLWDIQEQLSDFSSGFLSHEADLESLRKELSPPQRQRLQQAMAERYTQLVELARQANDPFDQDQSRQLQTQLTQKVLYERYVPAREIYHFGDKFLNGYTPQKMQTVRGYFDQVFEGNYAKTIPEGKRASIIAETDERYTEETGKPPNREDQLWKTLRNIETSERFPDLWNQFRDDLSGGGVSKTVVSEPRDPKDNVLENPLDPGVRVPEHTGHGRPEAVDTESKGFDVDAAPKGPNDTAHRDGEKPAVTNVFESSKAKLRYKLGPNDTDWRGSDITFKDALDGAFEKTGIPREQFKVTKWGKDIYGKSVPVEYSGPGAAEISIDYAHDAPLGKNGEWQTGPDAPHIGWRFGKGTKRQVGHIIIDDVPAGRSSDKE